LELAAALRGLTMYDASYLELASRLGLPLASLDTDLQWAASHSGAAVIG
jgi:predicted nucleic acid-binding protein